MNLSLTVLEAIDQRVKELAGCDLPTPVIREALTANVNSNCKGMSDPEIIAFVKKQGIHKLAIAPD